ncbi:MAG: DUF4190 domain-containing protein [Verrucomicrobiales bacterium]|nr:DUF4190 domain-containing protein [Verrucomicrobiales bacterium]
MSDESDSPKNISHAHLSWSRSAIAGLIFGMLSVPFLGLPFAIPAVVFGHTGLWVCRKKRNPNPKRGRRAAIAGLLLGYFCLITFPIFLAVGGTAGYFSLFSDKFREQQTALAMEQSLDSIARLYLACETYASKNDSAYPSKWEDLGGRYLTKRDLADLLRSPHRNGDEIAFELLPHKRPPLPAITDTLVVIRESAPPDVPKIAIVYADGVTDLIDNPIAAAVPETTGSEEKLD